MQPSSPSGEAPTDVPEFNCSAPCVDEFTPPSWEASTAASTSGKDGERSSTPATSEEMRTPSESFRVEAPNSVSQPAAASAGQVMSPVAVNLFDRLEEGADAAAPLSEEEAAALERFKKSRAQMLCVRHAMQAREADEEEEELEASTAWGQLKCVPVEVLPAPALHAVQEAAPEAAATETALMKKPFDAVAAEEQLAPSSAAPKVAGDNAGTYLLQLLCGASTQQENENANTFVEDAKISDTAGAAAGAALLQQLRTGVERGANHGCYDEDEEMSTAGGGKAASRGRIRASAAAARAGDLSATTEEAAFAEEAPRSRRSGRGRGGRGRRAPEASA